MRKFLLTLVVVVSLCTPVAADRSDDAGCEPAGGLNVAAHRHALIDQGATARVTVDLKIYPQPHAAAVVVIEGRILSGGASQPIAARRASVPTDRPGKVRLTFELEQGIGHELRFDVRSATDPAVHTTATLRIDLDPAHQPEELDGVVQYRAQMQGGAQ